MSMPLPLPSDLEIRARCSPQSYERGRGYFRNRAVFRACRRGATIRALCAGTADEPYRVRVTFNPSGGFVAHCSCPIGGGGACKHVVALLLTWRERPDSFVEAESLDSALDRRSKPELEALLKHILIRQPELEDLLDLPFPGGEASSTLIDMAPYRRRVATAIAEYGENWGGISALGDEIQALITIADGFAGERSYVGAASVYGAIASEVIALYRKARYGEGILSAAVTACLRGLDDCLREATDPSARRIARRALFAAIQINLADEPELDLAHEQAARILIRRSIPDEKQQIIQWIDGLPDPSGDLDGRGRAAEILAGLRFDLEKETLDDEAFLRACRANGRTRELIDRLLSLGRLTEARDEAQRLGNYSLLLIADGFLRQGQGAAIAAIIEERLAISLDADLLLWLRDYHLAGGDDDTALTHAALAFDLRPDLAAYRALRELAQRVGRWETARPLALARLAAPTQRILRIRALLDDGALDPAIAEIFDDARWRRGEYPSRGEGEELLREVARAAQSIRPDATLEIYRALVEQHIGQRDRAGYQAACQILQHMHAMHEERGTLADWASYLADLRQRTRGLRALRSELSAAGL